MDTLPPIADSIANRFAPDGFVLLRAPALPIDLLESLATGSDPRGTDGTLQAWARDPLVQAAIYLASPSLSERLAGWQQDPDPREFAALRPALFRYFVRMTSRATPFGMFAATALGRIGPGEFAIGGRETLKRQTWLDLSYVYPYVARAVARREIREALDYVPNSTLFHAGDAWRYVEETVDPKRRRRDLVRVQSSEFLDAVLEAAQVGKPFDALVALLVERAADVSAEEAGDFTHQLIDSQLLVPTLVPTLTGPDPVDNLIARSAQGSALAGLHAHFESASHTLREIDALDPVTVRDAYRSAAQPLLAALEGSEEQRLFHVDLRRDGVEPAIPASIIPRILFAVEALRRMSARSWPLSALEPFRKAFEERYGERRIPLMAALDEETGVGFEIDTGSRRNEGLLADFRFPGADGASESPTVNQRLRRQLHLLEGAWSRDQRELNLTESDINSLKVDDPEVLPDVFTVLGTLWPAGASGHEAVGESPLFSMNTVSSGVGLFGRFCRSDPALAARVGSLLSREEALQPDAVFAELVHLPGDRIGNVVCRPALRSWDIPCLGASGLDRAHQISIADLTVGIEAGRIVLRSERLRRVVLPRLTCAHNVRAPNASIYRFLAALANQDGVGGLGFSWGPFAGAKFLPRVVLNGVVLSAASWRIDKSDFADWPKLSAAGRQQAIGAVRERLKLPRWVQVGQADNLLSLDLDNPLCVAALVDDLDRSRAERVWELAPAPVDFCLRSPEGRHAHELMIPFIARAGGGRRAAAVNPVATAAGVRRFPPGSPWLYAKIYGSVPATESALVADCAELVALCRTEGWIDAWHFVRYRDPHDHLRVRFHGDPRALHEQVLPRLENLFLRWTQGNAIWRCELDTYEREMERYGGADAIALAEQVFTADSDAVVSLLRAAPTAAAADWRWRIGLRFADAIYEAFGLDLAAREQLAKVTEADFRREFHVEKDFEGQLSLRFRKERAALESLFGAEEHAVPELRWALPALREFAARMAPIAARFAELEGQNELTHTRADISRSLTHMHLNRMMLTNAREHELIVHAFLHRVCRARLARARDPG